MPKDVVHIENLFPPKEGGVTVTDDLGNRAYVLHLMFHYGGYHNTVMLAATTGMSRAQIEDIIGAAQKRFIESVALKKQTLSGLHVPSPSERADQSAVLREINAYKTKRKLGKARTIFVP